MKRTIYQDAKEVVEVEVKKDEMIVKDTYEGESVEIPFAIKCYKDFEAFALSYKGFPKGWDSFYKDVYLEGGEKGTLWIPEKKDIKDLVKDKGFIEELIHLVGEVIPYI